MPEQRHVAVNTPDPEATACWAPQPQTETVEG